MAKNHEILKTISLLSSEDPDTLEGATCTLLNAEEDITDELIAALKSPDENIRQNAASCLGMRGEPNAIRHLFNALVDAKPSVQASAAWALNSFSPEDLKQELNIPDAMSDNLEKSLKSDNWQIRWYALNILAKEHAQDEAMIKLLPVLKDPFFPIKLSIIWLLEPFCTNKTVKETFIDLLGDLNEYIRSEIAVVLGRCKIPDAIPALTKRVQFDVNETVRLSSLLALENIGGTSIKHALMVAVKDKNEFVRAESLNAFFAIINPDLLLALNSTESLVKSEALRLFLIKSDIKELEAIFLNALKDKSKYVFRNAIKNLSAIGQEKTLEILLNFLNTETDTERLAAIIDALGSFDDKRALKSILKFAKNPQWKIKMKVASSIGRIGNKWNVKILLDMMKDPNDFVKEAAISSLGYIGSSKLIDKLEKICQEHPYGRLGVTARKSINLLLAKGK